MEYGWKVDFLFDPISEKSKILIFNKCFSEKLTIAFRLTAPFFTVCLKFHMFSIRDNKISENFNEFFSQFLSNFLFLNCISS